MTVFKSIAELTKKWKKLQAKKVKKTIDLTSLRWYYK